MFFKPLPAKDFLRFNECLDSIEEIQGKEHVYYADGLIAIRRNMAFLRDPEFRKAFDAAEPNHTDRAIAWRLHALCWAGEMALQRAGDFVECGVYEGFSSRVLVQYLDFAKLDRRFHLYDLFDNPGGPGQGVHMPFHDAWLAERVRQRFADFPNVLVRPGRVPEVLDADPPEQIAFLHIDLNDAAAETAALDRLYDRLAPGAPIIFDDYGFKDYGDQQPAIDAFLNPRGVKVLELPTGQGLAFKP